MLPLRWMTQDLHYYWFYIGRWSEHPRAERREVAVTLAGLLGIWGAMAAAGYGALALFAWILPARIAIAVLSFAFDYLPHTPHDTPASEDRYRATLLRPHPLLTPVLLYQNYHLIHHLYPGVPFYRYVAVWKERYDTLIDRGAQARDLLGRPISPEQLREDASS